MSSIPPPPHSLDERRIPASPKPFCVSYFGGMVFSMGNLWNGCCHCVKNGSKIQHLMSTADFFAIPDKHTSLMYADITHLGPQRSAWFKNSSVNMSTISSDSKVLEHMAGGVATAISIIHQHPATWQVVVGVVLGDGPRVHVQSVTTFWRLV